METSGRKILEERRQIWQQKPVVRHLYFKWYHQIANWMTAGRSLELGGGSGNLRELKSDLIITDIVSAPWLDLVSDAHTLPFKTNTFANIVLFDVLHHLAGPLVFFSEAKRALKPGGRLLIMEPYVSPLSFPVYQFLHTEGMNRNWTPFKPHRNDSNHPFSGNQAVATRMFGKFRNEVLAALDGLKLIHENKQDFFVYPLSGGFHQKSRLPHSLLAFFERMETVLSPIGRWFAFRVLLVFEKRF